MRDVLLSFPDTHRLADFLITHKVQNVLAESWLCRIRGIFDNETIDLACTHYAAVEMQIPGIDYFLLDDSTVNESTDVGCGLTASLNKI